jgi:type II secretory pathway pseudopilin PulG
MTGLRALARRTHGRDEDGMTLVELVIAFLLMGILFTAAISATVNLVNDSIGANTRVQLTSEEQVTLDVMTREIGAATYGGSPSIAVSYASPTELEFYAALNPSESGVGPEQIELALIGSSLVQTTWLAAAAGGGSFTYSNPGTLTLATDVDSSHGALFSYYASGAGNPLATLLTDSPTALTVALGTTANISTVHINLWMDPGGAGGNLAVDDNATVNLLNVAYTNP